MKPRSFIESFNSAVEGITYVLKTQRNMRIHFIIGILVLLTSFFLHLTKLDLIIISIVIAFVLVVEMINTALEKSIDLIGDAYHPLARITKDITAGTVLVSACLALFVGYLVFITYLGHYLEGMERVMVSVRESPWHITFISLIVVILMVILAKAYSARSKKFFLSGGMPSLHCALAGSIWVALSLITTKALVSILVFILLFLVAHSRIRTGIHTLREVIFGALLGILATVIIFQLLGG